MLYVVLIAVIILILIITQRNTNIKPQQDDTLLTQACDTEMAVFSKTQLIGGARFWESYYPNLIALHNNKEFMYFIKMLRTQLGRKELTETKSANRQIANEFFYQKINDKYPEVNTIAQAVKKYGTQASAHISIYYAMYILDAKQVDL